MDFPRVGECEIIESQKEYTARVGMGFLTVIFQSFGSASFANSRSSADKSTDRASVS